MSTRIERILLVHGAGATPLSWRYLAERVGIPCDFLSYDVHSPFDSIVDQAAAAIRENRITAVVGHSFGGVVAWHAARICPMVRRGASVSSPWGGTAYGDFLEAVTLGTLPTRFFQNVARDSRHLREPREVATGTPWMNVVTTRAPFFSTIPNDGVVTVRSQRSIKPSPILVEETIDESHSEVLLTDELVELVRGFVSR